MKQKGFTLIELLVVIAIIGVLSSIVIASLSGARGKARDAKRITEKRQLITAFNLYLISNDAWPSSGGTWKCLGPSSATCWGGVFSGSDALVSAMAPYMSGGFPTNDVSSGNLAFNHVMYHSNITAGGGSPVGAWIVWVQENTMTPNKCPTPLVPPQHYDNYWYCYEFLGP